MLCPEEMLPFHQALENFFRSTFHDEIQRLPLDDPLSNEAFNRTPQTPHSPTGQGFNGGTSISSAGGHQAGPAMTVGRNVPSLYVPSRGAAQADPTQLPPNPSIQAQQTPLQRQLAHLTRHGMGGMSASLSGGGNDSLRRLSGSTSDAVMVGGRGGPMSPGMYNGGASLDAITSRPSYQASTTSRLSRFGSLLRGSGDRGGGGGPAS